MAHPCHLCGAGFKQLAKLKSHLVLHEEVKTYKCDFCEKLFSKSSNLYSHIRTHTGEKPYQCKVCSRQFPRLHNVRSHLIKIHRIDTAEVEQMILTCDKETKKDDNENLTTIKTEPLEDCQLSPNTSVHSGHVDEGAIVKDNDYYTIHTGTQVSVCDDLEGSQENNQKKVYYKCKVCYKTLSHKSNMEDHVRSHTGVKLFKCRLCGKGLSRKQNLVHHLRHIHFIKSSQVDQNIIRANDSCKEKKVRIKRCKVPESETNIPEIRKDIRCNLLKRVTCDIGKLKDESVCEYFANKEASVHVNTESGEIDSPALLEGNINQQMEADRDSDTTMSNTSVLDETTSIVQPDYVASNPNISVDVNIEDVLIKVEYKAKSNSESESPDLFSDIDKEGVLEHTDDTTEDHGRFNSSSSLDIGDEISEADSVSRQAKGTEQSERDLDSEQMYIVLNADNPSLKMYKCRLCGFECKRRYYMAVGHALKHSTYKPYLCVICCKPYSRKFTLRCHIIKKHNIDGTELDDIMSSTGNKVFGNLPESYTGKINSTKDLKSSKCSDAFKTDAENDHLDTSETAKTERLFDVNETGDGFKSDELSDVSADTMECSDLMDMPTSPEKDGADGTNDLDTSCSSVVGETHEESMSLFIRSPESDGTSGVPDSPMSKPGSLPSFFTSVFNMINNRQPKRACPYNEKIKEWMDLNNLKCLKCHKKCTNKSNLKQHIKFIHINQKEFACFVCSKKFSTKFNLKMHLKQHGAMFDGKPNEEFACQKCGKQFKTKSYLKVHSVNKHGLLRGELDETEQKAEIAESTSMDTG